MLVVGLHCPNMAGLLELSCIALRVLSCNALILLGCTALILLSWIVLVLLGWIALILLGCTALTAELHCSDNVGPHPAVGARDYTGGEKGDASSHYDHYHTLGHLLPDSQASGYFPIALTFSPF